MDNSVINIFLINKENCALKLVDEIILYYDAQSKKHQNNRTLHITHHGNNYVPINFSENLGFILMSTKVYLSWRFGVCILKCPLASYFVESGLPVLFVLPRRSVYVYVWRSIDAGGMRSPVWTGIRGNDAAKRKQIKVWEIAHGIGVFSRLYIVQTPLHTFIHTSHLLSHMYTILTHIYTLHIQQSTGTYPIIQTFREYPYININFHKSIYDHTFVFLCEYRRLEATFITIRLLTTVYLWNKTHVMNKKNYEGKHPLYIVILRSPLLINPRK